MFLKRSNEKTSKNGKPRAAAKSRAFTTFTRSNNRSKMASLIQSSKDIKTIMKLIQLYPLLFVFCFLSLNADYSAREYHTVPTQLHLRLKEVPRTTKH
jgi:hypothetical protein